jgi:glutathione S-transferase
MKLYNSLGPNPRLVRMFLIEKAIELPTEEVDLMAGANRKPPYTDKNPAGGMPSLELDDGSVVSETVAICEYLEERNPQPPLIGASPEARAEARMWQRRVELKVTEPLTAGFRSAEGLAMFKDRMRVIPQAADDLKAMAQEGLAWFEGLIGDRDFICGDRFSLPDITLYCFLDFGIGVGQPLDSKLEKLAGWFARVSARPSAEASLHPVAKAGGMRA